MEIRERYVTFETARLLFEKGFMWQRMVFENTGWEDYKISSRTGRMEGEIIPPFLNTCYNEEGKEITPKYYNSKNKHYPRPTQAMAAEWILQKFDVFIQVEWDFDRSKAEKHKPMYFAIAIKVFSQERQVLEYAADPYVALEIGIKETLKLLI